MIANLSLHTNMYHLYLDLNKALNSVPHNALWKVLSNFNIPTYLINLIKNLYAAPYDYSIVNGSLFSLHTASESSGKDAPCYLSSSTSLLTPSFFTLKLSSPHKNLTLSSPSFS